MLRLFFFLTIILVNVLGFSQDNFSITYVGNMGVYISNDQSSILIDGLHTKYGDDYLFPNKELVDRINSELKPNAILFTHHHGDHFSAQLSSDYLTYNKKNVLFGPSQVTKKINGFEGRKYTITTKNYSKQTTNLGKITITGLKINHAGKRHITVENVGYIITIGDKKVLHVGDTNWLEEIKLFDQLKLIDESIDIAFLPYWMLLQNDAPLLIKKYITQKQIIATHISPRIKKQELLELKERYPKIHFLTILEQQIQL